MKKNWSKWIIVIILILIVVVIIVKKSNQTKSIVKPAIIKTDSLAQETIPVLEGAIYESLSEPIKPQLAQLDKNTLAVVNNFPITKNYLDKVYQTMPDQFKAQYKNDKEGFLEQLIIRELLYQEAVRQGFNKGLDYISDSEQHKDEAINRYIIDFTKKIKVSDQEIQAFYNANINQMRGMTLDQVKNDIKNYLAHQKQGELFPQLIDELITKAHITRNEQWLKEQRASKPENPLNKALKNGMPTVLDLGSATCVPCKMMKPIFAELEKEYQGKANIILLDIYENRELSSKYKVRVIPTQIFFDKTGTEVWRHEGYLSKEDIIKKLIELDVE